MSRQGPTGQDILPVLETLASKVDALQEYQKQEPLLNKDRDTFSRISVPSKSCSLPVKIDSEKYGISKP